MKALLPVILLCSVALTAFAPASTLVKQEGYTGITQVAGTTLDFKKTFKAEKGAFYTFTIEYEVAKTIADEVAPGQAQWANTEQFFELVTVKDKNTIQSADSITFFREKGHNRNNGVTIAYGNDVSKPDKGVATFQWEATSDDIYEVKFRFDCKAKYIPGKSGASKAAAAKPGDKKPEAKKTATPNPVISDQDTHYNSVTLTITEGY